MQEKGDVYVFMDDDANHCVIVGTDDRADAEKALRVQEAEWYGPEADRKDGEEPLDIGNFMAANIYSGKKKGEEGYYFGNDDDIEAVAAQFDNGEYKKESGFILALE